MKVKISEDNLSCQGKNLSVILITRNEEENIVECLQSVSWASEIIIVDSKSSDRTVDLARRFTDKIFVVEWKGYGSAKNYAMEHASNDWVLWIDADERVTYELAQEIQNIIKKDEPYSGYKVARKAYFLGKFIRYCGWYPGYVVRLFKKDNAKFSELGVHEKVEIKGKIGYLKNDLLHYTDENLFHYFTKFNRYTTLAAEDLFKSGKSFSWYMILLKPIFVFIRMFFLRLGFFDGIHGLILSLLSASYVFVKYAKLWEIQVRKNK